MEKNITLGDLILSATFLLVLLAGLGVFAFSIYEDNETKRMIATLGCKGEK